ncbi:ABC transporter permease [Neorhizobium sp. CSC1952]|uniref:NitT/TauT family transport system permease protein n=1 Tax=Xaviernesmea oryzae TaxID=464029 RepID=A0A1X7CMN8_9HYPH|nr:MULTISPECIES: ABC transporter permease [Rhizobium/Agrobacterium group]WJR69126.1 ABC transporter permease [Rhizobium sp. CSC1952]SME98916.1 NitT/TauT family transport system permease protein [Xaviernesmea oryzae]
MRSAEMTAAPAEAKQVSFSFLYPSRSAVVGTLAVLLFLVLWQVAPSMGWVNGRFTSRPTEVFLAAIDIFRNDNFLYHARISLTEFVAGFALAIVVSIPLGVLLGTSKIARYLIDPPLMALYIAPTLVLLPILVIWLGIDMAPKIAVVFLGAVFPIVLNTMAGMSEADPKLLRMARSFGASKFDIFSRVLVPGSLPALLTGIRLAVGRAVLGVVVGELFVSQAGIGYQLNLYGQAMRIDRLLVYALVVSAFGYTLTILVRSVENKVRDWRSK